MMKHTHTSVQSSKHLAFAVPLMGLLMAYFLLFGKQAGMGASRGLSLVAGRLIPALFPFLVLAGLAGQKPVLNWLAKPFGFLGKLFFLPKEAGAIFIISLLGGYPVGALLVANSVQTGLLTKQQAARLLCSCVHAAPSFLVGFLGGQLGVPLFGWGMVVVQGGLSLLCGVVLGVFARTEKKNQPLFHTPMPPNLPLQRQSNAAQGQGTNTKNAPFSLLQNMIPAIGVASQSMLMISGCVVFFSALVAPLLPILPAFWGAFTAALTEISGGLPLLISALPFQNSGAYWIGFCLGMGGLCVWGQVVLGLQQAGHPACSPLPFLVSRLFIAPLTGLAAWLLAQLLPQTAVDAMTSIVAGGGSDLSAFSATPMATLLLMGLCGLLFSLGAKAQTNT